MRRLWRLIRASAATLMRLGTPVPFSVNLRAILLVARRRSSHQQRIAWGRACLMGCLQSGSPVRTGIPYGALGSKLTGSRTWGLAGFLCGAPGAASAGSRKPEEGLRRGERLDVSVMLSRWTCRLEQPD